MSMSVKRKWAWVNALHNRIERHNAAIELLDVSWQSKRAAQIDGLTYGNSPDNPEEPFIIWEGWEQLRKVAKLLPNIPQRDPKYPDFDSRVESGFSDEYITCSECSNVIRTSPDCYYWQPKYVTTEHEILCEECVESNPESVMDEFVNNCMKFVPEFINLPTLGWVRVNEDAYEAGMHPGQDDNPAELTKPLVRDGIDFVLTYENSQFYVKFWIWVRNDPETGHEHDYDDARRLLGLVKEESK